MNTLNLPAPYQSTPTAAEVAFPPFLPLLCPTTINLLKFSCTKKCCNNYGGWPLKAGFSTWETDKFVFEFFFVSHPNYRSTSELSLVAWMQFFPNYQITIFRFRITQNSPPTHGHTCSQVSQDTKGSRNYTLKIQETPLKDTNQQYISIPKESFWSY